MRSRSLLFVVLALLLVGLALWLVQDPPTPFTGIDRAPDVVAPDEAPPVAESLVVVDAASEVAREALEPSVEVLADVDPTDPFVSDDTNAVFEVLVLREGSREPVPGARVRISVPGDDPQVETDEVGLARFEVDASLRIAAVRVLSTAVTGAFYEASPQLPLPGETVRLEAVVGGGAHFAGRCVDESGAAVAGAVVRGWARSNARGTHDRETVSDANGAWRIEHLGPDAWIQAAHDERGLMSSRGLRVYETDIESAEGLELVLVPSLEAEILVVDRAGEPVEGARVMLQGATWIREETTTNDVGTIETGYVDARTDAAGSVPVEELVPRAYTVSVLHSSYLDHKDVHDFESGRVEIVLELGLGVSGLVLDAQDRPAAGASVRLGPNRSGRTQRGGSITDEDGRFTVSGLEDLERLRHEPWLVVLHEGHAVHVMQPVDASATPTRVPTIRLEPGASIAGRVVADGRPIGDAAVWVDSPRTMDASIYERPNVWEVVGGAANVYTTPDGRFELTNLFRETYTVRVAPFLDSTRIVDFQVEAGAEDVELEISAEELRGVVFHGLVTNAFTGAPVPTFEVAPYNSYPVTGANGEYEHVGNEPGRTALFVSADGYIARQTLFASYATGEHRVDVQLVPAAKLRVRVVDENGDDWGQAGFVIVDASPQLSAALGPDHRVNLASRATNGATLTFGKLPAGSVDVIVLVAETEISVPVDLAVPMEEPLEVIVHGHEQVDREFLFAEIDATLDPDEVATKLRSDGIDDRDWVAVRRAGGSISDPGGRVDLSLDLDLGPMTAYGVRRSLTPIGDSYRLEDPVGRPMEDVDEPRVRLRLLRGDWVVEAALRDLDTHKPTDHTVSVHQSPDGSQLDVVLFIRPAQD